ncbi:TPA: hypothetical protein ACS3CI_003250 [Legionella pneumophila]
MTELHKNKLSVEDHQKAVLFQFMTLYERWSEDRQVSAKQGYDLANRLEQFSKEVDRFSSIEEAVIVKLRKSLNEATLALSEKVNTATAEALNTTLGSSIARMEKTSRTVETILASNQQIRWLSQLKTLSLNVLCSFLVSGLVLWFFMPQPTLPLAEEDMNTYVIGKRFARIWPTLPKEKQEWFLSESKEKRKKKIQ